MGTWLRVAAACLGTCTGHATKLTLCTCLPGGRDRELDVSFRGARLFLNSRREILAQSRSAEAPSASGKAASSNAAHDHHRMPVTMTSDDYSGSNSRPRGKACAQIYRPPPARSTRQRTDSESSYVMGDHQSGKAGRGRRPDQMLYVPRGRRNIDSGSVRGTPTPMQDYEQSQRAPSPTFSICSVVSEYSGRNRYSKHDSRHGSQLSIYDGDFDRIKSKPPLSKGEFSRESTPGNGRQKGGNRFNSQTLQLIERCLNQDSEPRLSDNRNWDSDSVHSSPAKNNRGGRGRNQKSPTPTRDIHSVHSKENVIHPVEPNSRTRKGRRNRRRNSRSREPSAEKYNDSRGSPGCNSKNGDPYNSPHSERGFGSCERVFYNSNFNSPGERYDRGYDNYDRYSSINNSRASSRNSSRERTPQHASYHTNWRGASSPSSPAKGYQNRNSPGKPPSGRLDQSYHDEPSYSSMETVDQGPSLLNGGSAEHRLENIKENPSFDSSYSSEQNTQMNRVEEMHVCEDISQGSACDTSSNGEVIEANQTTLPSDPAETDSSNGQPLHIVDNQSNAVSDELSSTAAGSSGKVYFDLGDEAEDPPEALAREAVAMENDTQNGIQAEAKEEASEQEKEEKKNLKKFSFNWADEVEDSWDTLYDDSGECLDPEIKRQLSDSIGKVKLVKPTNDYYDYQPKEPQINEDEYAHVIEIYDFPVSFKTQDLMMIFSPYQNNGFDIKWVDDTHALGIFATALIAKEALSIDHPFLKARSLSLATETSRSKAMRITEALLPYKPRPATSAALARRLVSGALGLKVNVPHEVREAERQKLKDAKAQKKLAAKQRSDAWEGTLT
ncbi:putative coiled-coil domain-containing protein R3HCC1L isoform X2 [Penaeus vannamei]|uniref:Putative coiled-coil domain-containing protein R3HCC1L isoform X2 n=1 Tax=Penaeus vannamei TaxID=6689 RepID=A0A3R7P5Y1_PENVA|nr:putative coiled-coil domain-containing protein R3HCC1L isoform X2 [Penaeus vannamei]